MQPLQTVRPFLPRLEFARRGCERARRNLYRFAGPDLRPRHSTVLGVATMVALVPNVICLWVRVVPMLCHGLEVTYGDRSSAFMGQRQQSGSLSTIRTASIESNGVVDSLTETPHPGQLQTKASLGPAGLAFRSGSLLSYTYVLCIHNAQRITPASEGHL